MEKIILVINLGSSSKKYSLFRGDALLYSAHFEQEGEKFHVNEGSGDTAIGADVYKNAVKTVLAHAENISAIGMRVVAPGSFFANHRKMDEAYIESLRQIAPEVALHANLVLTEIDMLKTIAPGIAIYGLSDSAFHHTLPTHARIYGLPTELAKRHDIYRFGYHGLSIASVVEEVRKKYPVSPARMIVCHLGSGGSITAVKDGTSIDTSMGFSPLEGLVMSSRVGSIDPGAVLTILEKEKMSPAELRAILYKESGLLGVSGISEDMRVLIEKEKEGHAGAHEAINLFVYRAQLLIGAYSVALDGLDLLVFTGTMGERSEIIRGRICAGLLSLGITANSEKIAVVHANEALQMKRELLLLLGNS